MSGSYLCVSPITLATCIRCLQEKKVSGGHYIHTSLSPSLPPSPGQFWSRPITIVQYGSNPDHYLIEIPGNTQRQMIGDRHSTTWQREKRQCFYVGDRQGGRGLEIKGAPNEPLIEGVYTDYIMDGPYDTSFTFSRFGK